MDATNGVHVWDEPLSFKKLKCSLFEKPYVFDGKIFIQYPENSITCIDIGTKKELWSKKFENQFGRNIIPRNFFNIDDRLLYQVDNYIYCLDPSDGEVIWSRKICDFTHNINFYNASNGLLAFEVNENKSKNKDPEYIVFVSLPTQEEFYRIDSNSGWTSPKLQMYMSGLALVEAKNKIGKTELVCFDVEEKRALWSCDYYGYDYIWYGKNIYFWSYSAIVPTKQKRVYVVDIESGNLAKTKTINFDSIIGTDADGIIYQSEIDRRRKTFFNLNPITLEKNWDFEYCISGYNYQVYKLGTKYYVIDGFGVYCFADPRRYQPVKEDLAPKIKLTFTVGKSKFLVGDQEIEMNISPFLERGKIFLPMKFIISAYKGNIKNEHNYYWNTYNLPFPGDNECYGINSLDFFNNENRNESEIYLNGEQITFIDPDDPELKPIKIGEILFLPSIFIAKAFELESSYDEASKTIILAYQP